MRKLSLLFLRWGAVFLILGVFTGYGPLGHYLMGGANPSCPTAPVHGHTVLLGFVAMTIFGLVYRSLSSPDEPASRGVRAHYWLSVVGVLGEWFNGTFGYAILSFFYPGFYYEPAMVQVQIWFGITGLFLTAYSVGCVLFLRVVWVRTRAR